MSRKAHRAAPRLWNLMVIGLGIAWMMYDPTRALGGLIVILSGLVAFLKGVTVLDLLRSVMPQSSQQQEETQRSLDDFHRHQDEISDEEQRRWASEDSLSHREVMRSPSDDNLQ